MKHARYALVGFAAAAMLAGCSSNGATPVNPSTSLQTAEKPNAKSPRYGTVYAISPSGAERVVYSFKGSSDGANPLAGLLDFKGTLYGTTYGGGANGKGTVFALTPSGTETVLHSFGGSGDGAHPQAGLIEVQGTLYGTTREGGADNLGTVFSITASGAETVLHSFAGHPNDGQFPEAALLDMHGTFYGTTEGGGSAACGGGSIAGCGTVFEMTEAGAVTILHSFGPDGVLPEAALISVGGKLYGTAAGGGDHETGTVFSCTTSGATTQVYSFKKFPEDGAVPKASLLDIGGTLYSTTSKGGAHKGGTIFTVTTSGTETMLHSFGGPSGGGETPVTALLNVSGTLYGTTYRGGAHNAGVVFSSTASGTENEIHAFGAPGDGRFPAGDLIDVNGTLYGTTSGGGSP